MRIIITILWFLVLTKTLFFWLWLWQLKEYHFGRFRAHFETQKIRKLIASFYRVKFPRLTPKTLALMFCGIVLEILILFYVLCWQGKTFYFLLLISLILSPLIFSGLILLFQIPTALLRKRLLKKARKKRGKFKNLIVVGITGSYGKTSTKEFLAGILSRRFNVLKTKQHINAEIGIAQTILNELAEPHEIFIAEIGAYEQGKIKEVCLMVRPKIGILTGIAEQHLSTFGSLKNIIKAKYELIESLPQDGLAVFNGSNKYCRELYQKTLHQNPEAQQIGYGADKFGTGQAKIAKKITSLENFDSRNTQHLFPWDIENLLLAEAAAETLGLSKEEIIEARKEIKSPLQIKKGRGGLNIIDSTYSANPKSILAHLEYLKGLKARKVLVMPCLIELGSLSKEIHQKIGEELGKVCGLAIITTKDRFKQLKEGAQKSGMAPKNILFLSEPKDIFAKIKSFTSSGDFILLESRVSEVLIKMLYGN